MRGLFGLRAEEKIEKLRITFCLPSLNIKTGN
jgi:hypothetical protein